MDIMLAISGKWQRRIILTLTEAGEPLSLRQLWIRCGVLGDKYGSSVRRSVAYLVKVGLVCRVARGRYALHEQAQ
jgi:hypothetical protein